MDRRAFIGGATTLAAGVVAAPLALAQGGGTRIIYPFAAGGAGDALIRILAQVLQDKLGEPVIVDNRTGADGRIGVRVVTSAAADGHTLLYTPIGPIVTHPVVYSNLPYDTFRDLAPVTQVVTIDFGLAVGRGTPAKTLPDFIAWLKANPDKASFATPGAGTLPHFFGVMTGKALGIDFRQIPYKGSAPALTDVMGGQVPMMFAPTTDLLEQHKVGAVRVLAVSGASRSPFLPEVPTFREQGLPIEGTSWYGIYAPAKSPPELLARISGILAAWLKSPEGIARLKQIGFTATGTTPQELAAIQQADFDRWAPAIRASGFKAED